MLSAHGLSVHTVINCMLLEKYIYSVLIAVDLNSVVFLIWKQAEHTPAKRAKKPSSTCCESEQGTWYFVRIVSWTNMFW